MSDIVKKDPPPAYGSNPERRNWKAIAARLKAEPGEWFFVGTSPGRQVMTQIKMGRLAGMDRGDFDAVSRTAPDGKFDIYARYVGDGAA